MHPHTSTHLYSTRAYAIHKATTIVTVYRQCTHTQATTNIAHAHTQYTRPFLLLLCTVNALAHKQPLIKHTRIRNTQGHFCCYCVPSMHSHTSNQLYSIRAYATRKATTIVTAYRQCTRTQEINYIAHAHTQHTRPFLLLLCTVNALAHKQPLI